MKKLLGNTLKRKSIQSSISTKIKKRLKKQRRRFDILPEFKKPLAALKALEKKHGKAVPCTDFIIALLIQGYKPLEVAKTIELLNTRGMIFEPKEGYVQRVLNYYQIRGTNSCNIK